MSLIKEKYYIIAYDIRDKKRLTKVHRILKEYAMSLQHSVFIAPFSNPLMAEIIKKLNNIIKPSQDDIRIYPLSETQTPDIYGHRKLPDGIFLNNILDHQSKPPKKTDKLGYPYRFKKVI